MTISLAITAISAGQLYGAWTRSTNLRPAHRKMIAELAELIIPRTDTPGAIEAGVPEFVVTMVRDWYTETERAIFLAGLKRLDVDCKQMNYESFLNADRKTKIAALQQAESRSLIYFKTTPVNFDGRTIDQHSPFFAKLKELVVLGFFTSEVGATEALAYNPVPGCYDGHRNWTAESREWSQ